MPARDDFQNCLTAALTLGPRLPLVVRCATLDHGRSTRS